MLGIVRHIRLVSMLIAALFVAGSSGVAFVLQSCSMPAKMACCELMGDGVMAECVEQSQPANAVSFRSDMSCNTSTLVGGFTTNPGVVDNTLQMQKAPIVAALPVDVTEKSRIVNPEVSIALFAESISPPSVGKHILNASLLI